MSLLNLSMHIQMSTLLCRLVCMLFSDKDISEILFPVASTFYINIYVYIYIEVYTPPRCSVEINIFELE